MGLATGLNRSLDALKLGGAVQMRTLPFLGESVYSLPLEDRHHLTCLQCGNTIAIDECPPRPPSWKEQLHKSHHFPHFFYHTLEFFGLFPQMSGQRTGGSVSPVILFFLPFHPGRDLPAGKPAPVEGYPAIQQVLGASHQHQPVKRFQAGSLKNVVSESQKACGDQKPQIRAEGSSISTGQGDEYSHEKNIPKG